MKKITIITLIACLAIVDPVSPAQAQPVAEMVTIDEARTVAQNWITLIIRNKGSWGGFKTAELERIKEFKRGERVLGYFCAVKPQGFIVISLRKELAPVKAYSAVNDLDPESDEGMADLIKGGMERTLEAIEVQLGPVESVHTEDLEDIPEISHRQSWEELEVDVATFRQLLNSDAIVMDYDGGEPPLLSSHWHQGDPYRALCPTGNTGCTDCCPSDPQTCNPTLPTKVGCVATAGAQIMNYWAWPPYGVGSRSYTWDGDDSCGGNVGGGTLSATFSDTYDWRNMANRYVWDAGQSRWEDENGDPLTQAHLDAVAELSYEVGVAVGMDYGVCGSEAYTSNMEGVYENHYRYATNCNVVYRSDFSSVEWFERIKSDLNANRPLQYKVPGHSIVIDGWQEIGSTPTRQYHVNYGWGGVCATQNGCDTWYDLDELHLGDPEEEYMVEDIFPAPILWGSVSGTYPRDSFPYRYFDRDATGDSATFESGQNLQFLPDITVTGTSTTGGSIRFEGTSTDNTLLFTRGDESRGVLISDGVVKLNQGGSIKFP